MILSLSKFFTLKVSNKYIYLTTLLSSSATAEFRPYIVTIIDIINLSTCLHLKIKKIIFAKYFNVKASVGRNVLKLEL